MKVYLFKTIQWSVATFHSNFTRHLDSFCQDEVPSPRKWTELTSDFQGDFMGFHMDKYSDMRIEEARHGSCSSDLGSVGPLGQSKARKRRVDKAMNKTAGCVLNSETTTYLKHLKTKNKKHHVNITMWLDKNKPFTILCVSNKSFQTCFGLG